MKPVKAVGAAISRTVGLAGFASGITVLALLVLTVASIISREVGGKSIAGTLEYTEVLLAALVFLGLSVAEKDGAHVRTAILTAQLPRRWAVRVRILGQSVAVAFLGAMLFALTERAIVSTRAGEYRFGIAEVAIWPARIVACVGVAVLLVLYIQRLVALFASAKHDTEEETA